MGLPIVVPWRARRSPYAPFSMIRVLAEESNTEIQSLHVATLDERALGYIDELMQPWHQAVHENLREELPEHVYEIWASNLLWQLRPEFSATTP
jgi:hypothetical protein